ncbi:MAG: hypothetical protein E4G94_05150 [ANME-2 cluster archaeon]|nr:MAG: hypothetical protein E4G94_05150 [ANME-2 cluster archaeon]
MKIESDCTGCHSNITVADGFHTGNVSVPGDVHSGFDWEGDDNDEISPIGTSESCISCHQGSTGFFRSCEDCHTSEGRGPYSSILRQDYQDLVLHVNSHKSFPAATQGTDPDRPVSSCYSFGENGVCHGISQKSDGEYFAFNRTNAPDTESAVYHWTKTIDFLPDSTDCLFCHIQPDASIRAAWGNPGDLPDDESHQSAGKEDCWGCHVEGGEKPSSFHSADISVTVSDTPVPGVGLLGALVMLLLMVIFYKKNRE